MRKIFTNGFVVTVACIFIPPVGIGLLWWSDMSKKKKWTCSGITAAWLAFVAISPSPEPSTQIAEAEYREDRQESGPAPVEKSRRNEADAPIAAARPERKAEYGLEQWAGKGDRQISINSVSEVNGISSILGEVSGRIIVLKGVAKNSGSNSGDMGFAVFELEDSQGRRYDEIADLGYTQWRKDNGTVQRLEEMYPGEKRAELIAFRVAPDASDFVLRWTGNATIEVGNPRGRGSFVSEESFEKQIDDVQADLDSISYEAESYTEAYSESDLGSSLDYSARVGIVNSADGEANLRPFASTENKPIGVVRNGERLTILDEVTNSSGQTWYQVMSDQGDVGTAWVFAGIVDAD